MPSPLPLLALRSTAQVIKQSSFIFVGNFHIFFVLSLLLFSFRTTVENGSLIFTSFLDREPSVQALISRLTDPPNDSQDNLRSPLPPPTQRRRGPLLHLSRVGALDDDFFSEEQDDFPRGRRLPVNGSSINLSHFFGRETSLGLQTLESSGEDARVLEIAGSSFLFFTVGSGEELNQTSSGGGIGKRGNRPSDSRFFGNDILLNRRDAAALFLIVTFLSAAYGWVILGFLFSYCCVLGVVFLVVVNFLLRRPRSTFDTIRSGLILGFSRLAGLVMLRWAVRDAITQFLGLWFFSGIEDQFSFFKLFVKLKLMPFSVFSPWVGDAGLEADISGFFLFWVFLDTFVDFMFAIDSWVAILDTRRSGQEIVREGCYLMSTMFHLAVQVKCLESVFCGSFMRWLLARVGGILFASYLQSLAEVYFMVAWLIFYFAARCKDADTAGSQFGHRDLEDYIGALR